MQKNHIATGEFYGTKNVIFPYKLNSKTTATAE